jgi:hypothetical protein
MLGWHLNLTVALSDGEIRTTHMTFQKLIEALEAASQLKVHVDNVEELPLSQYTSRDAA